MAKEERRGGCLSKLIKGCIALLIFAILLGKSTSDKNPTPTETAMPTKKATATVKATAQPTKQPTATPTQAPTPAIPGTFRPGIEGTNAYDVTVAMENVGLNVPKRQDVQDGYSWQSETYKEGNILYNIEIETTKDYRVTSMQITMQGGNNNFVWWSCACMFGEESEQVTWLKENMWNETTTTKTFNDAVWTITPINKGVTIHIQHVDAESWYMSLI